MRASLRLLVINWQDRENPQAGGAEIHLHEIFGRLAARGHRITLLCSGWRGAEPHATLDGMEVHRVGGRTSFALRAPRGYRRVVAARGFDLVVEDINKIPLYTPLWVGSPVVALVPHLFGTIAFREASPPVAVAVWGSELLLPRVYRRVPIQAISESTADDLAARGFARRQIVVIHPGIDHRRFRPDAAAPKFQEPTFVYVGRLKRYKGIEWVLEAVAELARRARSVRFILAGKGDHERALRRHAERLRLEGVVEFRGFISEEEKVEILRRAWAAIYPSPKEGWGITNLEAAACGTPVIASDSPGLRDSVANGVSGLLVPHNDRWALVRAMDRLAGDRELRERLSRGAVEFARRFSWDRAADETEAHLLEVAERQRTPVREGELWA